MRKHKISIWSVWKKVVLPCIGVLLLVCLKFDINAETDTVPGTKEKVYVSCIDYGGMCKTDTDGTKKGYAVEYFAKIAEKTGWDVEFIDQPWAEAYTRVRNEEIDFYCVARRTETREWDFDFSTYPLLDEQMNFYVLPDREILYGDYEAFNGMSVGMLEYSEEIEYFNQYMEEHDFQAQIVPFSSNAAALNALHNHELDAVALVSYTGTEGLKEIGKFGVVPAYVMSAENSELMKEFNRAQQEIMITEPDFFSDLQSRYFSAEESLYFSHQEVTYIQNCGTITIGLIDNYPPLSYRDETGNPAGIIVDLMDLVSHNSGIQFEYKFLDYAQTGYDFLSHGEGDLVAGVAKSEFSTPNSLLLQSMTLMSSSIVFVGKSGTVFNSNADLTVAITDAFIGGKKAIQEKYPNFKFWNGRDLKECLEAVRDNKADVVLQNMYVVREYLQSPLYEKLEIYPVSNYPEELKVVGLPEDAILISVINKAIQLITEEERDQIVINHTIAKVHKSTLVEIVYKYRITFLGIGFFVLMIILLMLMIARANQLHFISVQRLNDELKKSNLQLMEAVKQANQANTAKSQFLSRMSHEIRTPMNAIVGLTALAKPNDHNPEKIDDYLGKIDSASHVLLGIINDVLDMSAIESDKMKIAETDFYIQNIWEQMRTLYDTQCKNKGILFTTTINLKHNHVIGDSLRLKQILLNLVSNAFKFTGSGGKIILSANENKFQDNQAFMRFRVTDTGCGMSEDMLERLFKPFEQESAETAQRTGGSGLGLSITYNLVQLMHGSIQVESKKGVGTTFIVDLPFQITEENASAGISTSIKENMGTSLNKKESAGDNEPTDTNTAIDLGNLSDQYDFAGHRLLLAEDNELNREVATDLLDLVHMQVDYAENGKVALEKFSASVPGTYDLILMDIKMPEMDGYEATKAIRSSEHPEASDIVIYAMTANAFTEDINHALSAGMNGHLAKPIDSRLLYQTIEQIVHGTVHEIS